MRHSDELDEHIQKAREGFPSDAWMHQTVTRAVRAHSTRSSFDAKRPWLPWTLALATAGVATIFMLVPRPEPIAPSVQLLVKNERMALGRWVLADVEPGAFWKPLETSPSHTAVEVLSGRMGFRLFHGDRPHALTVRAEGLEAQAVGTVFDVENRSRCGILRVHEGTVRAVNAHGVFQVHAGETLDCQSQKVGVFAWGKTAHALLEASLPESWEMPKPTPTVAAEASPKASPPAALPGLTPSAHWKNARAAMAKGDQGLALESLQAIVDSGDQEWVPLGLLERARWCAKQKTCLTMAREDLQRFLAEYPTHSLSLEARRLSDSIVD